MTSNGSKEMNKASMVSILSFIVALCLSPAINAQKEVVLSDKAFDRPGRDLPQVTPGPGWKTCPQCQNPDAIEATREKLFANPPSFNPRDISGVWMAKSGTFAPLDMKG